MEHQYIIVGLGNPGPEYTRSRHNAGFLAIDAVVKKFGEVKFASFKKDAEYASLMIENVPVQLVRPQGFMNKSGASLKHFFDYQNISADDVCKKMVVISDDSDMAEGQLKIVRDRGTGGHNGIEDIKKHFQTLDFMRIRIGIRPLGNTRKSETFVLTSFGEKSLIQESIERVPEVVACLITKGLADCQSHYNSREVVHEP